MGTVAIVDYGVGNLKSVANALSYLGCSSCITADPAELERADAIILPGVGAFPDAADRLRSGGLDQHVLAQGQKKPVLGICRGIQVMNVVLGGTLYQDIKPLEHLPHNDHWAKIHTVTVRRGTLLAEILKQDTVLVNSQHHQAASRVAPGLEIAALSEDGFIEALEKPDATFCLGVQWHPEWLSEADPRQQALFDAFVKACH